MEHHDVTAGGGATKTPEQRDVTAGGGATEQHDVTCSDYLNLNYDFKFKLCFSRSKV